MKITYKPTTFDAINTIISDAERDGKLIDVIELDNEEWQSLSEDGRASSKINNEELLHRGVSVKFSPDLTKEEVIKP